MLHEFITRYEVLHRFSTTYTYYKIIKLKICSESKNSAFFKRTYPKKIRTFVKITIL